MSNKFLLIVASSARLLVESARKAGYAPLAIDLFGDQDTRAAAGDCVVVDKLDPYSLSNACARLVRTYRICDVVYGAGLEGYPQSLAWLAARFNVLGNAPGTCAKVHDKIRFFAVLKQLDIAYPEISFSKPDHTGQWLLKPHAAQGGQYIEYDCPASVSRSSQGPPLSQGSDYVHGFYWQRYVPGQSLSVLFAADGKDLQIIGFNRQWTLPGSFIFAGVINYTDLPETQLQLLEDWLNKLVPVFNLKGLNSLDFIWDGNQCWVLEINPRPSASMAVYESDYVNGLVAEHIESCRGQLPRGTFSSNDIIRAYQIIYAPHDLRITDNLDCPSWCRDRPAPPCIIRKGRPICSIMASGNCLPEVYQQLQARRQLVINQLRE